MTKIPAKVPFLIFCSKYEHSQTYEMPGKLPNIEKIKRDMNQLNDWITEYRNRTGI